MTSGDPDEVGLNRDFATIRSELSGLVDARLKGQLSDEEKARYDLLCQQEQQLLARLNPPSDRDA